MDECERDEHLHGEPNGVIMCPRCASASCLYRSPAQLPHDCPYLYDPICGYTESVNVT